MPVMAAETVYIATAEQLTAFAIRVNNGGTTLNGVLTADIVLQDDISGWAEWGSNPPVGIKMDAIGTSDINTRVPSTAPVLPSVDSILTMLLKMARACSGSRNGATIKKIWA